MIFAAKLGPVQVGEERKYVYLGFCEGRLLPAVVSERDEEGLWGLLSYSPSEPRLCDESLAVAGQALGFEVTQTPDEFVEPLASMAIRTELGMSVEDAINDEILFEYARAATEFDDLGPWVFWHSSQAIEVSLVGDVTGEFEMSIMGAGGEQYGISLYRDPGSIEHVSALVTMGRAEEARKIDFLSMSLEPGPDSIIRALGSAFGLWCVPVPMKIKEGERVAASELDLLALAATLRATAQLSPGHLTGRAVVRARGKAIVATVRAPESERDLADLVA